MSETIRTSPFMTAAECADYLRMNAQTLYRWAQRGKIPARKLGGKVLFHQGDVDAWSASQVAAKKSVALSPFEQARLRLRSLKTEHTGLSLIQKGKG